MKWKEKVYWNALLLLLIIPGCLEGSDVNTEQRLIQSLLTNYSKQARPVTRQSVATNVTFGIEFIQLIKVDDRSQMLTSKIWVRQSWKNQLMTWNSTLWSNIQAVQADATLLWSPDIVLYNNADDTFSGGTEKYKTKIMMYANGLHFWLSPATFTSTCKIDITYFPFDKQQCTLKFGSWTFDVTGINIQPDIRSVITTQYINSSEWDITETRQIRNQLKYACCPNPYADVAVIITLKRKPLYYVFNVISPCLVLAATILFGFFLPPESGERISLTITILLAVAVFLQLVSDNLPRNSDSVPILAIFYMVIMTESAISLITTCIVLVVHYRSTDKATVVLPNWVRRVFFDIIAKCLKVKRRRRRYPRTNSINDFSLHVNNPTLAADNLSYANTTAENGMLSSTFVVPSPTYVVPSQNGISTKGNAKLRGKTLNDNLLLRSSFQLNCNNTLDSILTEVRVLSDNVRHSHSLEESQEEWKYLALVLDRLFFWIFLLTLTLTALATLLPTYFKNNDN